MLEKEGLDFPEKNAYNKKTRQGNLSLFVLQGEICKKQRIIGYKMKF